MKSSIVICAILIVLCVLYDVTSQSAQTSAQRAKERRDRDRRNSRLSNAGSANKEATAAAVDATTTDTASVDTTIIDTAASVTTTATATRTATRIAARNAQAPIESQEIIDPITITSTSDYAIVIDAGSTGSRSFIYEFTNDNNKRIVSSMKGMKVTPGLSSFVTSDAKEALIDYILPIFVSAAAMIPEVKHKTTQVYIKGTAGMRLLSKKEEDLIWSQLHEGLNVHPSMPFTVNRKNFGTIDGKQEAYFAVLSSNFIAGSIDGDLKRNKNVSMVGALDMGGSSTQMIFHTGSADERPVKMKDFWSNSWLSYGVEVMRDKMHEYIIDVHATSNTSINGDIINNETVAIVVSNPCSFVDHTIPYSDSIVLRGTGESEKCVELIKSIVWPSKSCASGSPCSVDGIMHPPVNGHFYGMSVYFYAIDCIHQLGDIKLQSWPQPTIDELEVAVHAFCSTHWDTVTSSMLPGKHPYTRDDQLPNRCFEGLYMLTLLEYGFGFDGSARNITIALDVKGQEVEWTLGFAIDQIPLGRGSATTAKDSVLSYVPPKIRALPSSLLKSAVAVFKSVESKVMKVMQAVASIASIALPSRECTAVVNGNDAYVLELKEQLMQLQVSEKTSRDSVDVLNRSIMELRQIESLYKDALDTKRKQDAQMAALNADLSKANDLLASATAAATATVEAVESPDERDAEITQLNALIASLKADVSESVDALAALQATTDEAVRSSAASISEAVATEKANSISLVTEVEATYAKKIADMTSTIDIITASIIQKNIEIDDLKAATATAAAATTTASDSTATTGVDCNTVMVTVQELEYELASSRDEMYELKSKYNSCNEQTLSTQQAHASSIVEVERRLMKNKEENNKLAKEVASCKQTIESERVQAAGGKAIQQTLSNRIMQLEIELKELKTHEHVAAAVPVTPVAPLDTN